MAVFIAGMKCPLCGLSIVREDRRRMFPPFVRNRRDPLYVFHDARVHGDCLSRHPRKGEVEVVMRLRESARESPRTCAACHEPILLSRDGFSTEYLTSDEASPMFEFNYVNLPRAHFSRWPRWSEFAHLAATLQASEAWDGGAIVPASILPE